MPSRKMQAAAAGREATPLVQSPGKTRARFSIVPDNEDVARVQEDMRAQSDATLKDTPFRNGRIIDVEFDGVNPARVAHGLGGPARGFIMVNNPVAAGFLFRQPITDGQADTHIEFMDSGVQWTATVWVWR